ncbi:MAG: hypothetical protein AB7F50_09920 [Fimbriimonadaceae bacterium]
MRSAFILAVGIALCGGCVPTGQRSVDIAEANKVIETKNRPRLELPKDLAGLEALGIKFVPDSVLAEGEDGLQIEDKALSTVVRAKLYSPGSTSAVIELMSQGLENPRTLGSGEEMRLIGSTKDGDTVDVMLGPATGGERTMIFVYVTREK